MSKDEAKTEDMEAAHKEGRNDAKSWGIVAAGLALAFLITWGIQQWWVKDIWRGLGYAPSTEMTEIAESLELTGKGKRIFAATRPALEGKEAFNEHCDSHDAEVALLGCYAGGQIFVYEIEDEDLRLANNVTMAHELLHAVWERTDEKEKAQLEEDLKNLMAEKQEWFDEELEAYTEAEKLEEVYTRAGTKLAELPEELEKNYGEIFQNRAKIVEYYETYSAPFEELQEKLEDLEQKITAENTEIETARADYEQRATTWEAKVAQFNSCARSMGCFKSDAEFQSKRQTMTNEQAELENLRQEINRRIDENNARVDEYNELRGDLGELNDAINSNTKL